MHAEESINASVLLQITTLKEEVEMLRADRERVNSSVKDIIHGAEGYKVRSEKLVSGHKHACYQKTLKP